MARNAVFLALAALALAAVAEADFSFLSPLELSLFGVQDDPQCSERETSCVECNTVVRCTKLGTVWVNLSNDTCSGKTPFCASNGTCQATAPEDSDCGKPKPVDTFLCPGDGYWPDMASCTHYYFCTNSLAYRMDCSAYPNTVYDHASTLCAPRTAQTPCFTLACPSAGTFRAYTPDPRIYAYCRSTKPADALVVTCDEGQALNATAKACEPACLRAGRFDTGNNTFNECVDLGSGRMSQPSRGECPGKSTFDKATQRCKPEAATKNIP